MDPKQSTMGEMADVLKKLYAEDLSPGPKSPKKNGSRKGKKISDKGRLYILIGTLLAVMFAATIVSYNQIISYREAIYSNKGRVRAEMQRRTNLFNNLVELYLSYTNLEKETFSHIAEVRNQVKETQKLIQQMKGQGVTPSENPGTLTEPVKGIDSTLTQLLAVVEQYPTLQSFEPHKNLILNIVGTEDRIATERGRLNMSIRKYNNMIAIFPYKYMAYTLGFERIGYLEIAPETKQPPTLKWNEFLSLRQAQEAEK